MQHFAFPFSLYRLSYFFFYLLNAFLSVSLLSVDWFNSTANFAAALTVYFTFDLLLL
jgi:hypothetical protein